MATTPKPNIQIDDLVREMTDDEYAQYQTTQAQAEAAQAEADAKAAARLSALAKLAELGLTEAEINAL
jgi:membrane protease subunit (stomatin/prohibitin family)